ncbi:glycine zipper 2TM domain-containing protein [Novosphingobium cyanobacteriorum]|uniref:17 kDa surface antigen n=1 Tax=Novosphingobium cyanobacteriorum TaxID=3024215 RepID=A0ABT6CNS5_9SPHN|nr:glycine zipper 2TM domain-containing protein [Novosphingobium cyanobacteriorum]MDF8333962.1 hypothetical protein [Novosphingobium cyanobacteriorum]
MKFPKKALVIAPLAAAALLGGCSTYGDGYYDNGPRYASDRNGDWGYYDRGYYDRYGRYDWNNPDPSYGGYYADRYYRENPRYRERRLSYDDRVYRGRDGRYYCRRSDGSTGIIVGGLAGAALGAVIAEGDSKPLGAIIGAMGGAIAGGAVDSGRNRDVRCR